MPDISMCKNHGCPLNQQCYRYKAEPSFRQSYADFKYKNGCDYFSMIYKSNLQK